MILRERRTLGAIALIVAGIGAFIAPFLIHGPALQANSNGNGGGGTTPPTPPGPGQTHKKTLQDLMNSVSACDNQNHPGWTRSLEAKIRAAMNKNDSTKTDNNLNAFDHQLNTPAAAKHVGPCVSDITDVLRSITG